MLSASRPRCCRGTSRWSKSREAHDNDGMDSIEGTSEYKGLEACWGCLELPALAPSLTVGVLLEGRGGGPRASANRPKSNQMGWGPYGAAGPFVTVICPAAEITNTFLSEGLAATGLWALMPPSCGHTGPGG